MNMSIPTSDTASFVYGELYTTNTRLRSPGRVSSSRRLLIQQRQQKSASPSSTICEQPILAESPPPRKESKITPSQSSPTPSSSSASDKRYGILHELLSTEQTYVSDLKALVAMLTIPLLQASESRARYVEPIIYPLQILFAFQHRFLQKLLCQKPGAAPIAQAFIAEASGFEAYVSYCTRYQWICDSLNAITSDTEWMSLVNEIHKHVALCSSQRRLTVQDFLIKPIQRICKYPLFMKELLKHTDQLREPGTAHVLQQALELMRGVCERIDHEQQRNLAQKLRETILGNYQDNKALPSSLVGRLGEVLLSGPLQITTIYSSSPASDSATGSPHSSRPSGCILFNRFLIVVQPKKSLQLIPQFWFPLHTMKLIDTTDNSNNDLQRQLSWRLQYLVGEQSMLFEAQSGQEKRIWMEKLSQAIDSSVGRMCSIKKRRSSYRYEKESNYTPATTSTTSKRPNRLFRQNTTSTTQYKLLAPLAIQQLEKRFDKMTSPEIKRVRAQFKVAQQNELSRNDSGNQSSDCTDRIANGSVVSSTGSTCHDETITATASSTSKPKLAEEEFDQDGNNTLRSKISGRWSSFLEHLAIRQKESGDVAIEDSPNNRRCQSFAVGNCNDTASSKPIVGNGGKYCATFAFPKQPTCQTSNASSKSETLSCYNYDFDYDLNYLDDYDQVHDNSGSSISSNNSRRSSQCDEGSHHYLNMVPMEEAFVYNS